ncbi:MAG: hypothetical protein ACRCUT_08140 [Spirochaetota bacterium]
MRRNRLFICFVLICAAVPLFSCDWSSDTESKYKFAIVCDGAFYGYYRVDGGEMHSFSQAESSDGHYYTYEVSLDSPDSVFISVNANTVSVSSIDIQIFYDGDLVEEKTVTQSDSTVKISATINYTFTTDDDDDDTAESVSSSVSGSVGGTDYSIGSSSDESGDSEILESSAE